MLIAILLFLGCAVAIIVAGTFLTKASDDIAEITGLGRLLIGSILLAGATSLPELTVDISAVRLGSPDLALGDLLGSGLANLLILAVLDLSQSSRGKLISRVVVGHALSGALSIALIALVGVGLIASKSIPPMTFLGIGPAVWAVGIAYVLGVRMVYLDQMMSRMSQGVAEQNHVPAGRSRISPFLKFAGAAAVILFVGPWLAHAADEIAKGSGLGGTFVGTTFVAISTSLPELITSLAAVRMGSIDLAVGNVYGSNAFNMLILIPCDIVHPGSILAVASPAHSLTCLAVVLCTSIMIMGQLYSVETRRRFIEPDAWTVIGVICGALYLVYLTSS